MATITHPTSEWLLAKRYSALLLVLILTICTYVFGEEPPVEQWVARYDGPGNDFDAIYALAVDSSGSVYVTGRSDDSSTYGDFATIKYGPNGNQLWVARYDGPVGGLDQAFAITVDSSGNVHVAGESRGANPDYGTVKYGPDGNELWVSRYDGPSNDNDYAVALAVDSLSNVYVTGRSIGDGTSTDYATVKYSAESNELWVARYNGPGNSGDGAYAMTLDNSENIYVTGSSIGIGTSSDYATLKYSPDGNQLWVARYNGDANLTDSALALAVDNSGNVCVTGYSTGSSTYDDYATVKYSPDGNQLWVAHYNGPGNTSDRAYAITVDDSENIYVTGWSNGSGTSSDYATLKYSPDGNQLWVARYNGPGNGYDATRALVVDNSGNVYVTGRSWGSAAYDYATVKYSPDGNQLWVARYNGPVNDDDDASALVVDNSGDVYVAGQSTGSGTDCDYATIKYVQHGYVIYVDATATGANDGSSWANAYNYLQDVLADPNFIGPAEIWVAEGAYKPDEAFHVLVTPGDRTATFQLMNGVEIYGGFPTGGGSWESRNPKTYETILSGDIGVGGDSNDNSCHVVTGSGTDQTAILDGFTITKGDASIGGLPPTKRYGGGMFNNSGSPTINNCTFIGNSAVYYGGGMFNLNSSNLILTHCTFSGNSAGTFGGGMYNDDSNSTLTNCIFMGNSAGVGGGFFAADGQSILSLCTIRGNVADGAGGIYYESAVAMDIDNSILWGNSDSYGTSESAQILANIISVNIDYCCVQGWTGAFGGIGNISVNPLFKDAEGHLWNRSLCRNAGDPNGDYSGQTDMDGQHRVIEGRVDIGADELPPPIQNIDTGEVYEMIQDAIDDANNGETIVIQDGIYYGEKNTGIDFNGKAITLRSSDPNDLNVVAATIIDCNNECGIGVYFQNGEGTNTVLNGLTIANASSGGIGGGIYCYQSSPTIKNCILKDNTAGEGGGIYCQDSSPTIHGGTIRNNSPAGIFIDASSSVLILGVVNVISNNIVGAGSVQIDPNGSLNLDDAHIFCSISGAGTLEVAVGAKATIDGNSVINLSDPCNPNVKGSIDCEGLLIVKDNSQITNARMNITKATFEDKAYISNSDIYVDSRAPYGSVFADPNTSFVDVNIYADGDRYMDLDPSIFDGNFINIKIFVTITEGTDKPQGGLLECRGDDGFADVNSCYPNNIFFCMVNPGTVPDCNTCSWTLERLELIPWAKVNLTNRFGFQPPYNPGDDDDVLYVRELILREGSILNTSYNRIYYESLIKEPNALIKNEPLLGFSMINIAMDDQTEFMVRITHNNYTHFNDPNYNRTHVERVEDLPPDVNGMMVMRNLEDLDPNSVTYGETIEARAKGLFAKSGEDEIFIRFEYLFGAVDPNTELVIYLSDIPELGDVNDPNDYLEVARLSPPLPGQVGSVGSNKFGVFKEYVPTGGLNFIRGTRIEFMLLGGTGVHMYINNWDPQVHCSIVCLDITGDRGTDEEDFLTALSNYGTATELPTYACLEGPFGENGTVDSTDICGWDWALNSPDRLNCCSVPLVPSSPPLGGAGTGDSPLATWGNFGCGYLLNGFSEAFDDLLVCGKKGTTDCPAKLKDGLYVFNSNGQYLSSTEPDPNRANIRLVEDFDGNAYQINSETGILSVDSGEIIVWPAPLSGVNEPRYETSATVYIGVQGTGDDSYGRPISDAAFDIDFADNNYIYIVPVVVEPAGQEAYLAAAKLQLTVSSYSVAELYDDPDAADLGDNRELDYLCEVEVDTTGNLYVLNAYVDNESDILWKYNASSGTMIERLVLSDSNSANYVPSPSAMYLSTAQDMLYLASSLNTADANSSTIYGFSTSSGTLTLAREITVNGMGHVTSITEDPTNGTLWVAGFSMDPPEGIPNPYELPFYDPNLAGIPIDSNNVNAICLSTDPNSDLALPLSIVWTGAISLQNGCDGADLDSSGDVDLKDLAVFAEHWCETSCVVPDWCGGADLDPYIRNRGQVDFTDLAIFVQNWLESDCLE